MTHEKHSKKHKKQQQLLKNLHTLHINQQAEVHGRNRDLDVEREEELRDAAAASSRAAAKDASGKPVWSAKLQMIRDKNTGRERMAKERWNRFAGTEGGGGRGL
jgi:plasmid maintenance system killer protein